MTSNPIRSSRKSCTERPALVGSCSSAFLQDLIGVSKVAEMFQVPVDRAQEITTDWLRPKHELVDDGDL